MKEAQALRLLSPFCLRPPPGSDYLLKLLSIRLARARTAGDPVWQRDRINCNTSACNSGPAWASWASPSTAQA
jgi:hypothetical protein